MAESSISQSRRIRAAQYVRMSTEHQQYSTENQAEAIGRYAVAQGMDITKTYSDEGKSGLSISGRSALARMILDVESGMADYEVILVYDVSRWGRFQDSDESAYYEYLCKRARIDVHYCAELFPNDGSHSSALLKTIKRTMAGEYSRELSVKVFAGQCRLIELGFRQGGMPGYGLRRQLVDQNKTAKAFLGPGERKSIQTDRVILVLGPAAEVAVVREIYQRFLEGHETEQRIADELNRREILNELARPWTASTIRQVLTNPKYTGANVYNRRSFKLKKKHVVNPPAMWILRNNAFDAIVEQDVFRRVQVLIHERRLRRETLTDDQMLALLRQLLAENGSLSGVLINETDRMPSSGAYRKRFKSLYRAYELIGYTPDRDFSFIEVNRAIRLKHRAQVLGITEQLGAVGADVRANTRTGILTVNDEFTVSVVLSRCCEIRPGAFRWLLRLDGSLQPDVTIAVRMQPGNEAVLDYYLLPGIDALAEQLRLAQENSFVMDVYRFTDLSFFLDLARRQTLEEVA